MKIDYTKEETIKLLEEYYKRLEDREVKVSIKSEKGCIGIYETEGCITHICVSEEMDICGMKKKVVTELSDDEFKTNLRALFNLYGFTLSNVTMNDGISSRWEGYGMAEHQVSSAYFKGISINVEKAKETKLAKTF